MSEEQIMKELRAVSKRLKRMEKRYSDFRNDSPEVKNVQNDKTEAILKVVDRLASDMVSLSSYYGTEIGYIELLLNPKLDSTREEAKRKIKSILSGEYDNK